MVEIIDYEEHLYTCTFDELIKKGVYKPDEKKLRVGTKRMPIFKIRFDTILKTSYGIGKAEGMVIATMLGASIIQHDERVRETSKIWSKASDELSDSLYAHIATFRTFRYVTNDLFGRGKITGYEDTINAISTLALHLGMFNDQMVLMCYLTGLKSASKIPEKHRKNIDIELANFWAYVDNRLEFLKVTCENANKEPKISKVIIPEEKQEIGNGMLEVGTRVQGYKGTRGLSTHTVGIIDNNIEKKSEEILIPQYVEYLKELYKDVLDGVKYSVFDVMYGLRHKFPKIDEGICKKLSEDYCKVRGW